MEIEAKAHRHHRRHDQPRILENKKNSYKKTSKKQREGTELGKTLLYQKAKCMIFSFFLLVSFFSFLCNLPMYIKYNDKEIYIYTLSLSLASCLPLFFLLVHCISTVYPYHHTTTSLRHLSASETALPVLIMHTYTLARVRKYKNETPFFFPSLFPTKRIHIFSKKELLVVLVVVKLKHRFLYKKAAKAR